MFYICLRSLIGTVVEMITYAAISPDIFFSLGEKLKVPVGIRVPKQAVSLPAAFTAKLQRETAPAFLVEPKLG